MKNLKLRQCGLAALFVIVALFASLRSSPLCFPEGGDNGVYMTGGWLLTKGWLPYRDFFDHKSPLIYFVYALGWLAGGRWPLWVIENASFGLACFALFRAIKSRFGGASAWATSAVLILLSRSLFFLADGKPEQWALISYTLSAALLIGYFNKHWAWFIVGILSGISFLFKVTAISIPVAIGLVAVICFLRTTERSWWVSRLSLMIAGGLCMLGLATVWLVSRGIFQDFVECCFEYNRYYSASSLGTVSAAKHITHIFEQFFEHGTWGLAAGGAVLGWIGVCAFDSKLPRFIYAVSIVAVVMEMILISMTGRFYSQYFTLSALPFSILLGLLWVDGGTSAHPLQSLGRMRWVLGAIPVIPFVMVGLYWNVLQLAAIPFSAPFPALPGDRVVMGTVEKYRGNGKMFVWGPTQSRYYHQNQMMPVTRDIYMLGLWTPGYGSDERIAKSIAALQQSRPAVIVDTMSSAGVPSGRLSGSGSMAGRFLGSYTFPDKYLNGLREWIRREYHVVETAPIGIEIWTLNGNDK